MGDGSAAVDAAQRAAAAGGLNYGDIKRFHTLITVPWVLDRGLASLPRKLENNRFGRHTDATISFAGVGADCAPLFARASEDLQSTVVDHGNGVACFTVVFRSANRSGLPDQVCPALVFSVWNQDRRKLRVYDDGGCQTAPSVKADIFVPLQTAHRIANIDLD